ncbi:hypothetical protein JCM3770_006464, partial [Rhodotorula araucariae]
AQSVPGEASLEHKWEEFFADQEERDQRYSEERDRRRAAFEERQRRPQSTTEDQKPDVKPADTRVEDLERAFQALKAENDVLTRELEVRRSASKVPPRPAQVLVVDDPESGDDEVATLSSRIKAEKPKAWCGEFDEIKCEMWIRSAPTVPFEWWPQDNCTP